jgi:hypothetical protein
MSQQDHKTVVMSDMVSPSDVFGVVRIETHVGDEYCFPNMNVTTLKCILPEDGRLPATMPCLVMVNVSMATITIPMNVIRCIRVGAEALWNAK